MSNLKRHACQTGKVIVGLPIVAGTISAMVAFAFCLSTLIAYLLAKFLVVQLIGLGVIIAILLGVAFLVGDDIFRKYNICQRFK